MKNLIQFGITCTGLSLLVVIVLLPLTSFVQAQHLFKCTTTDGTVVFSQTPCGDAQTESWVKPMPNMGVKGNNRIKDSESEFSSQNSTNESADGTVTKSVEDEVARINRAVNQSIKEVWGNKKTNSASVMKTIASMEVNRLNQIASIPIYSETDKKLLISSIDRQADRAVNKITGTSVSSVTAKAEIEMTRTSLKTAISNL